MVADFDNAGAKVLSPSKLAHVVLRTNNFATMVDFYKKFLGAEVIYENDFLAFLTYDDEHHRLAIAAVPGTVNKNAQSCGLEHIAFTFDTLWDLLLAYRQRKTLGIDPFWPVNHGPTTSIYYKDPDGNMIETQVDNFDKSEDATEFMKSKYYDENPVGVDIDPEDLIARLRQGESENILKKRVEIGPRGLPEFASA
jgi:catechol-2,3-dioxygenase